MKPSIDPDEVIDFLKPIKGLPEFARCTLWRTSLHTRRKIEQAIMNGSIMKYRGFGIQSFAAVTKWLYNEKNNRKKSK